LTRTSWLKKIWKGRSKGVSTVIGTVFLILIIFMVSTNVLLWTFSQNAQYTQAAKDVNQDEADRRNEKIEATDGDYSVSENEVTVEVTLTNTGAVAAQMISLWVFDTSIQTYNHRSLSLSLNPGSVADRTGDDAIAVAVDGAIPGHEFISWFVTARGNTIALEKEELEDVIVAQVAQGIGYLAMDFDTFRYFEYVSDYVLKDYPAGSGSYIVPRAQHVVFRIRLTNYDPSGGNRSLTLNSHSLLWMYYPAVGKQVYWYIVNVSANGTISPTYSDIIIGFRETTYVYFASASDGTFTGTPDSQKPGTVGPAAINLLLLGKIGLSNYGQNIPFVSVYCT